MLHKIFISLLVCIQAIQAYSQDTLRYKSILQINPSFGFYSPLTTLLKGDATDPLLKFDDRYHYWQVLSLSFFFHKHWGITFNYQAGNAKSITKKNGQFIESMQSQYGKDYYVTPSTGDYNDDPKFLGDIQQGYLGVIYRLESGHFFMYPKLAIGITSFYTNWGSVFLKQKNANDVIRIFYLPNKVPHDHFTLAASASMGYKITKRVFLSLNVLSSYYKTNISYTQTTTDLNSGQSATDIINYKSNILSLGLGAGLIIVLH
jgi:hypothetical protein